MTTSTLKNFSRLAALALVAVGAFAQTRNVTTSTLTSQAGRFQVEMPGQPQFHTSYIDTAAGKLAVYSYTANINGQWYTVMYNDYPVVPTNADAVLDSAGSSYMSGSNLVKKVNLTLSGNPGRGYVFERGSDRYVSAVYLVGARLYQVMYMAPKSAPEPPELSRYYDSFRVL